MGLESKFPSAKTLNLIGSLRQLLGVPLRQVLACGGLILNYGSRQESSFIEVEVTINTSIPSSRRNILDLRSSLLH